MAIGSQAAKSDCQGAPPTLPPRQCRCSLSITLQYPVHIARRVARSPRTQLPSRSPDQNEQTGTRTTPAWSFSDPPSRIGCTSAIGLRVILYSHTVSFFPSFGISLLRKRGREKAMAKAKNKKVRRCHGCGEVGQAHDKRNCPALTNP